MSEVEIKGTSTLDGTYELLGMDRREAQADRWADELEGAMVREDGSIEGRVKFRKCPHCRRAPTFERRKATIEVATGVGDETMAVPTYGILPCCTARYARDAEGRPRVNKGLSRLQELRLKAQLERAQKEKG